MIHGVEYFSFCAERFDDLIRGGQCSWRSSFKRREQKWGGVVKRSFGVCQRKFFLAANRMPADGVEAFGLVWDRFSD